MTAGTVLAALSWAAPPLAGGLIGLAAGRLAARLSARGLADGLLRSAASSVPLLTASLLEKPLAELFPDAPRTMTGVIRASVEGAIRGLVLTPRFLHDLRQAVSEAVTSLCALSMQDFLSRINAKPFLIQRVLPGLATEKNRKAVALAVSALTAEHAGPFISDETLTNISALLGKLLPGVVERLIEWLESAEMRDTIAARGRELLPRILEKLNVMQRLLLSAGQFDRRIDEQMPAIVQETLQALERIMRDPTQQRAMQDSILLAIRDWRGGPGSREETARLIAELVDGQLRKLAEPAPRENAYRSLEAFLSGGGQTVGAFLRQRAGLSDTEFSDSLANSLLSWLSRPETAASLSEKIAGTAAGFLRDNASLPVGRLLGVDPARKEKIDGFLRATSSRVAAESGGELFASARVRFLRYAGWFGLVVGLATGLLQDALRLLAMP